MTKKVLKNKFYECIPLELILTMMKIAPQSCKETNHEAPLSIGLESGQEYWSGLPFPSPGDLPDPGIKPASALAGRFFTTESSGKPIEIEKLKKKKKVDNPMKACTRLKKTLHKIYPNSQLSVRKCDPENRTK